MQQLRGRRGNPGLNNDEQYADVDALIRKLVSHVVRSRDSAAPADPEFRREEAILDIGIDGVGYVMVRVPLHVPSRNSVVFR